MPAGVVAWVHGCVGAGVVMAEDGDLTYPPPPPPPPHTKLHIRGHLLPPPPPTCTQINEEAELHNRLLDELDEGVEGTSSRLAAAQRRLRLVMRRSGGTCKSMVLMFLVALVLVVVVVLGFKIAIHL